MTAALTPFQFEGHDVRALDLDGEPWFVAKDVAGTLGYANPQKAVRDHCKVQVPVGVNAAFTPLDPQTIIIPERDVYRLIMKSQLPAAERFEEWVVAEVLPTIRRTGSYAPAVDPIAILNDPVAMRGLLLTYSEKVLSLEADRAAMLPKVEAHDRIAEAYGSLCITDAAKTLQVPPKALFRWLRENLWIYRRPGMDHDVAYQTHIATGRLIHKVEVFQKSDGTDGSRTQVRVTPNGMTVLAKAFPPAMTAAA